MRLGEADCRERLAGVCLIDLVARESLLCWLCVSYEFDVLIDQRQAKRL